MGYQYTKYGSCAFFSSFARGRKRLEEEEEETEEKTKYHNHKIYAGLHPGIDYFTQQSILLCSYGVIPFSVYKQLHLVE